MPQLTMLTTSCAPEPRRPRAGPAYSAISRTPCGSPARMCASLPAARVATIEICRGASLSGSHRLRRESLLAGAEMGRSRTSKHARYGPGGQALRGIVAAAVVVLCLCLCASAYASRAATSPGPPVNTSVPVVKGTPKVGKKVKANAGKWSGSKPIGYSYQWKGCDTTGEACTNINGATGSSYIPTSEQVGDTLRVVVTATNSVGEASVESPPSKPVAAGVAATRIDLCGPIAKSLTLSAELAKVYVLTCTVTVPAGTTLTITPGTVIKSENSYGLSVQREPGLARHEQLTDRFHFPQRQQCWR